MNAARGDEPAPCPRALLVAFHLLGTAARSLSSTVSPSLFSSVSSTCPTTPPHLQPGSALDCSTSPHPATASQWAMLMGGIGDSTAPNFKGRYIDTVLCDIGLLLWHDKPRWLLKSPGQAAKQENRRRGGRAPRIAGQHTHTAFLSLRPLNHMGHCHCDADDATRVLGRPILFWVLVLVGACQSGTMWAGLCLIQAPSTVRPLARDPRVLIGWPFPLGFGLYRSGRALATGTAWAGLCLIHHHHSSACSYSPATPTRFVLLPVRYPRPPDARARWVLVPLRACAPLAPPTRPLARLTQAHKPTSPQAHMTNLVDASARAFGVQPHTALTVACP